MRLNKIVSKAEPKRIDTPAKTRTVTVFMENHIVVCRHAVRGNGFEVVKTVRLFVHNLAPHTLTALSVKSRFVRYMRHKTRLTRSGRCENYRYHWLTLKP